MVIEFYGDQKNYGVRRDPWSDTRKNQDIISLSDKELDATGYRLVGGKRARAHLEKYPQDKE